MSNELQSLPGSGNDGLAELLRHGALEERPAFSEELHSRIMLAIRSAEPRPVTPIIAAAAAEPLQAATRRNSNDWQHSSSFSWVALAAGLLVMAIGGWQLARFNSPAGVQQPTQVAVVPGVPITAANDGTYTWADLDHDARLTAQLVVDQMPFEAPYEDLSFGNQQ